MTGDGCKSEIRRAIHIVNISGGKDSTACYLLALERGRPFRAVMADTGHEHDVTMDYAASLGARTGGPGVEFVRADFSRQIKKKRDYVRDKWPEKGVDAATIDRALAVLHPTGNPFLDLCIWKGRFPSRKAQFCTEFLKTDAIWRGVLKSALQSCRVVQWLGVRRDESLNRRNVPKVSRVTTPGLHQMAYWRPLVDWTARECFDLAARHGLDPNPLYKQGMGRVGCFPCINANKGELAQIAVRYPEAFERLREWEQIVGDAARRGQATFFAPDKTPQSPADGIYPNALDVSEWARTGRGGKQFDWILDAEIEDGMACSSQYGLCE